MEDEVDIKSNSSSAPPTEFNCSEVIFKIKPSVIEYFTIIMGEHSA